MDNVLGCAESVSGMVLSPTNGWNVIDVSFVSSYYTQGLTTSSVLIYRTIVALLYGMNTQRDGTRTFKSRYYTFPKSFPRSICLAVIMRATETMTAEPTRHTRSTRKYTAQHTPTHPLAHQKALTSIVPDMLKPSRVVQNRAGDGRASERAEGHDRERHARAHPDLRDLAHTDGGLGHDRDEDAGGHAVEDGDGDERAFGLGERPGVGHDAGGEGAGYEDVECACW